MNANVIPFDEIKLAFAVGWQNDGKQIKRTIYNQYNWIKNATVVM